MTKKKSGKGMVVKTKAGSLGIVYHSESKINGKLPVHLVDEDYNLTGGKVLVSPENTTVCGFVD